MKEFPKTQHKRPQLAKMSIFRAILCAASCVIPATRETKSHFDPFAVLPSLAHASGLNPTIHFPLASYIRDSVPAGANNQLPTNPYFQPQNSPKNTPQPPSTPLSLNTDRQLRKLSFYNQQGGMRRFLCRFCPSPTNFSQLFSFSCDVGLDSFWLGG